MSFLNKAEKSNKNDVKMTSFFWRQDDVKSPRQSKLFFYVVKKGIACSTFLQKCGDCDDEDAIDEGGKIDKCKKEQERSIIKWDSPFLWRY